MDNRWPEPSVTDCHLYRGFKSEVQDMQDGMEEGLTDIEIETVTARLLEDDGLWNHISTYMYDAIRRVKEER